MKISMDKKYTCGGEPIRILCIDGNDSLYPVIGLRDDGTILKFREDGKCTPEYNLVEVWEPQVGEWCLFTNETLIGAWLLQFLDNDDGRFHALGVSDSFDNCYKFAGTIPEYLKGNLK
jgi:hypothetical protein